jgi:hypothetical protein
MFYLVCVLSPALQILEKPNRYLRSYVFEMGGGCGYGETSVCDWCFESYDGYRRGYVGFGGEVEGEFDNDVGEVWEWNVELISLRILLRDNVLIVSLGFMEEQARLKTVIILDVSFHIL